MNYIKQTPVAVLATLMTLLSTGCSTPVDPANRNKFVGTWNGTYGCDGGSTIADKMTIATKSDNLELTITIHADSENPDQVNGTLTANNEITISEQSMGGGPGKGRIAYLTDGTLEYIQSGGGITCEGSGYAKKGRDG